MEPLKNINLKYIGALFLIFVIPSFLHIKFNISHSNSFFISFITLSILTFRAIDFKNNNYSLLIIPFALVLFVFFHGILSSLINDGFDYERFFLSIIYLISIIFSAFLIYLLKNKIDDQALSLSLIIFSYTLLIFAYLSAFGFNFSGAAGKPVLYFDEPCKFALISSPFFAFILVKRSVFERYLVYGLLFKLALMQPSITLMISVVMAPIIFLEIKQSIKFITLFICIALLSTNINSNNVPLQQYFYERLPNKTFLYFKKSNPGVNSIMTDGIGIEKAENGVLRIHGTNKIVSQSLAVYYSGWARGLLNFIPTYGLGLGFQQLGYRGILDEFQILLYPLNLKDGSSVGAKLLNEFGFFGILFMFFYLKGLWVSISNIRLLSKNYNTYREKHEHLYIFLDLSYVAYFLLLFVRGAGYFDASFFLLLISFFYSNFNPLRMKK